MRKHGGIIYEKEKELLDFSANIHPNGMPEAVRKAMTAALGESVHYPDPDCITLRQSIAKRHRILAEHIICGNGAAELIFYYAFVLKAHRILLPVPAFTEYEDAFCAASGGTLSIDYYKMDQNSFCIKEDILDQMKESAEVLILCNPNNPTGLQVNPNLLNRMMEKAKENHIHILLDECFLDFVVDGKDNSLIPRYREYPNLFILKSFTKMYGIPGVRLGYGISADTGLIAQMKNAMQSWNVSHIAQAAGIAACGLHGYEEKTARDIAVSRRRLFEKMRELGLQVWEGSANFLFFRAKDCTDLQEVCRRQGVYIRHCNHYRGIGEDYYRVAVRTDEENEQLIRSLKRWKEGSRG